MNWLILDQGQPGSCTRDRSLGSENSYSPSGWMARRAVKMLRCILEEEEEGKVVLRQVWIASTALHRVQVE